MLKLLTVNPLLMALSQAQAFHFFLLSAHATVITMGQFFIFRSFRCVSSVSTVHREQACALPKSCLGQPSLGGAVQ